MDYNELEILEEREKQTVSTLKESGLVLETDKELLNTLSEDPELQSEMLLVILKKLKKDGRLDELRDLFGKKDHSNE